MIVPKQTTFQNLALRICDSLEQFSRDLQTDEHIEELVITDDESVDTDDDRAQTVTHVRSNIEHELAFLKQLVSIEAALQQSFTED